MWCEIDSFIEGQNVREVAFIFIVVAPLKTNEWNSCSFQVYKCCIQTKLGSMSIEPKACEEI